ncbi:MAG TPA: tRNA(Ile)-lysidine synthetase, partial [Acidimicrobiales bacterium]
MKCRVCRGPAVISLPRHNANFCADHFAAHCKEQVQRAIDHFQMIRPGDRVLVAVSGGKDSLALWDLLVQLGYRAEGLYLGLGIGEYSEGSGSYVERFAADRDLTLHIHDLREEHGF